MWARQNVDGPRTWYKRRIFPQDAQKAVQQGRSERRGEEVQTALRVGRSPVELILANGKSSPVIPKSERLASTP
jgi:hypothetical protein